MQEFSAEGDHTGLVAPVEESNDAKPVATFSEEVFPITGSAKGATVVQDHLEVVEGEHDFKYYFLNWTLGSYDEKGTLIDSGTVVADDSFADKAFVPQKVSGAYQEAVYIAHFATPVAVYEKTDNKLVFSYAEDYYELSTKESANGVYPVIEETKLEIDEDGDPVLDTMVVPKWYSFTNYYGYDLPQFAHDYRNIVFEPSFKNFKNLKSTACWFASIGGNLGGVTLPDDATSNRYLETITGLENVYTENIESTNAMFTSMKYKYDGSQITSVDTSPKTIDLST